MLWTHEAQPILTTVMTHVVVDKSTDNAKPNSICFLPQYQHEKKCLFQRERAEKGIAWQVDVCSVVWTLIDNGNQITRLLAIVVKIQLSGVSINFEAVSLRRVNDFNLGKSKEK